MPDYLSREELEKLLSEQGAYPSNGVRRDALLTALHLLAENERLREALERTCPKRCGFEDWDEWCEDPCDKCAIEAALQGGAE